MNKQSRPEDILKHGTSERFEPSDKVTPFKPNAKRRHTPEDDWTAELILTDRNKPRALLANAVTALSKAPQWKDVIAFDEFMGRVVVAGKPPFKRASVDRIWQPNDDLEACIWLQHSGIEVSTDIAAAAVEKVAQDKVVNPVLDFLEALPAWDKKPRLDTWMTDYLGAELTDYTSAVARKSLIQAIARAKQAGCKADCVPILEGGQGIGKSKAIKTIFGEFFSDQLEDLSSKDGRMALQGGWGFEMAELDVMVSGRAGVERVKAFLSATTDRYRPPYGRRMVEHKRRCVFWGSTNRNDYLQDATGGRRFWPVRCGAINIEGLAAVRLQLWAEADAAFKAGETWWLDNPALQAAAHDEVSERYMGDAWDGKVDDVLANMLRAGNEVSQDDIFDALQLEVARRGRSDQVRLGNILRHRGWKRKRMTPPGKRRDYYYFPPGAVFNE